ncbi:MAG: peptidase MA family metallohydrolase [Gemmatimonadales bacterium]
MTVLLQIVATPMPEQRIVIGDITVLADRPNLALGTALAEAASEPHDWLGLGRIDAGPLLLILARDRAEFVRWSHGSLPSWGAGATFPGSHLVLIRLDAGDPYQTLRHELAHVVLHRAVSGRVPLWFDEGYAVLAAHEYGRFAALRLNLAVASGRIPELRALDGALRGRDNDAETAYALAGSAVAELARSGRNGELAPLLDQLKQGVPFDEAVATSTGLTLDRFETAWHRSLRHHYNWVVWLATGGMWLVVTLMLSWAAATRRRREAPRRAALDVGWPEPPPDDETITIQEVGPPST